jgi:hypothetical protein
MQQALLGTAAAAAAAPATAAADAEWGDPYINKASESSMSLQCGLQSKHMPVPEAASKQNKTSR